MTIAQGNNLISKLYLGSTEVLKAYLGTIQVYPNTEPTPTVQYIPNNAITIFPNYEALTTNNGRFPNGTSYNLNNAPSVERRDLLANNLIFRVVGTITHPEDYLPIYDSIHSEANNAKIFGFRGMEEYIINSQGTPSTQVSIDTTPFYFCIDIAQNSQFTYALLYKMEDGLPIQSTRGSFNQPSSTVDFGSNPYRIGECNNSNTLDTLIDSNKIQIDLANSGYYSIPSFTTYYGDGTQAILLEPIMVNGNYTPNSNITTFTNYQNYTTQNGKFLNGTSYNLGNSPQVTKLNLESNTRIFRVKGKILRYDIPRYSPIATLSHTTTTAARSVSMSFYDTGEIRSDYKTSPTLQFTEEEIPLSFYIDYVCDPTENNRIRTCLYKGTDSSIDKTTIQADISSSSTSVIWDSNYPIVVGESSVGSISSRGNIETNAGYYQIDLTQSGYYTIPSWDSYNSDPNIAVLEEPIMTQQGD